MSTSESTAGAPNAASFALGQTGAAVQRAGGPDASPSSASGVSGGAAHFSGAVRKLGLWFVVAIVVAMVAAGVFGFVRGPTGPWRIQYFGNKEFEGKPKIQHTRKVEFDWERGSPTRGIEKDGWSALFDTCMAVTEQTEVVFRLTSDDGGRLYVDGEMIVDNWGAHPTRTRTGKTVLSPGVHHLRIEYFEATATANLKLEAGFHGEKPETIPPDMLSQPGKSSENPCG